MKILWFSKALSEQDNGGTGTWMDSMARGLLDSGQVELGNIALGPVEEITRQDFRSVHQWLVPANTRLGHDKLPSSKITSALINAINAYSPDLVHVWGTEYFWGLLTARKLVHHPALLEMQGLKGAIARVFHADLSFREQLACIGLKEIIMQSLIFQVRQQYKAWHAFEKEIISKHEFISSDSDWMQAQVNAINKKAKVFRCNRALRAPFYESTPWAFRENHVIFSSAAYPSPFKGLHVAIRSLAILKKQFPDIQLRIAGAHQRPGIRREGYIAWITREIHRLNLDANVTWLGSLSAMQIVEELLKCSACVLTTFIESYGVTLAEAMFLGVPTVVSFTGGTSFLARDGYDALFFPAGDDVMCAHQLMRLLTDRALAERLSIKSQEISYVRHDRSKIVQYQIKIYRQILDE